MDAPGWISYAALAISGIAVVVSVLSFRASGPRIHLEVDTVGNDPDRGTLTTFTVINKGRGDTSIVGFHVTPYGERKPVVDIAENNINGPALPFRMEGNSREQWTVNILPAAKHYGQRLSRKEINPNSSWPSTFFCTVKTGSGKHVHAKSTKYDAYQVVAGHHSQ